VRKGIDNVDLSDVELDELAKKRAEKKARAGTLQMVCMANVQSKPISWLWPQKFARGKVSQLTGDPGLGKSLLTVAMATAVSTGAKWPVGQDRAPLGSVIMLSDEDALDDTIKPRLEAAGADCNKIHALKMVREITDDGEIVNRAFSLAKDVERLADEIEKLGDCVLVTIDPISAYLDGTDSHKNAEVRALLSPLSDLAERFKVAIIAVTHLNKGSGNAIYRSIGSIAFTAAARSVIGVTKDRDDPSRRLVLPVKNNLGCDTLGMAYRIETADNGAPVIMWEPDPVDIDINEALSTESDDYRTERQEAGDWLETELLGKPIAASDLRKMAAAAGHSWTTVKRAKKDIGAEAKKCGFKGGWMWYHPDDLPVSGEGDHEGVEGAHSQGVTPFGDSWSPSGEPVSKSNGDEAHI